MGQQNPGSPHLGGVAFRPECRENEDNRGEASGARGYPRGMRAMPGSLQQAPVEGRMDDANRGGQEANLQETQDEAKKIRRLQVMISMVMSVISQDPNLTIEEASELTANARRAALAMFPGKELAFDILYKPRLQRLMTERFRIQ
jgi:hypothetical protein